MRCKACDALLAEFADIDDDLCSYCFSAAYKKYSILEKEYVHGELETSLTEIIYNNIETDY